MIVQERPTIDQFRKQIESLFGQNLTSPASAAAEDFWNNWGSFSDLITSQGLSLHVDPLMLGHNFPEYRRYHSWKGAGKILFIVGLVLLLFSWPIGVALLILGIGLHSCGNKVRFNDSERFAERLMKEASLSPSDEGFAELCAHYIAGTVKLVSSKASAHWPQYPSNVITGEQSLIPT